MSLTFTKSAVLIVGSALTSIGACEAGMYSASALSYTPAIVRQNREASQDRVAILTDSLKKFVEDESNYEDDEIAPPPEVFEALKGLITPALESAPISIEPSFQVFHGELAVYWRNQEGCMVKAFCSLQKGLGLVFGCTGDPVGSYQYITHPDPLLLAGQLDRLATAEVL